jgi:hydroxylysine kinase
VGGGAGRTGDRGTIFGVRALGPRGAETTPARAEELASLLWGIVGAASPLPGEVDENFRLAAGEEYLLKVVPVEESPAVTDLVSQALLHVFRRDRDLPGQRIVPTVSGHPHASFLDQAAEPRRARLTTFVAGTVLRAAPEVGVDTRERLGALLARLAHTLADFEHPAAGRELSWDLRQAARMRAMLSELPPTGERRGLDDALAAFEVLTVPKLEPLPVQVVHNDLTLDNVVLTTAGELAVIDFGDIVRTQRINDLVVAMTAQLRPVGDHLAPALDVLRGYVAVQPLERREVALIYELLRTRVVTRIVGGEWRTARFPENRAYLGRNVANAKLLLGRIPEEPTATDYGRIEAAAEAAG